MLSLLYLALLHKCASAVFFLAEVLLQFGLYPLVVVFSPGAECLRLTFFCPVNEHILNDPALPVPVVRFVNPGVETPSCLHVNGPGNKVSHHFLGKTLHLSDDVVLRVIRVCDFLFVLRNRLGVVVLASLQLLDIVFEKLLSVFSHHLLPLHECCATHVAFNPLVRSVKELFSQLELPDESQPGEPDIFLCHVLTLACEPVTFLVDELHPFDGLGLAQPFFETEPCAVTKLNLFRDVDSTLKSIQHLSALHPLVVTPSQTFPHDHVSNALKFFDLLSGGTFFLSLACALLAVEIIREVLLLVELILCLLEQLPVRLLVHVVFPPH